MLAGQPGAEAWQRRHATHGRRVDLAAANVHAAVAVNSFADGVYASDARGCWPHWSRCRDVAAASANIVTSVSTAFVGTVSDAIDFAGSYWHGIDLIKVMASVTSLSGLVGR